MSFIPLYKLRRNMPDPDEKLLIIDRKGRVYLQSDANGDLTIPHAGDFPELMQTELPELGVFRNKKCYGCRWEVEDFPGGDFQIIDVREAVSKVDDATKSLLLRGKPILEWLSLRKFCSACGTELFDHEHEEARTCPNCGMLFFPKISPAVIVMIKREDGRILLAYNRHFRHKCYSLIAGFVEAGESAEDAVRREVREEVGLEIKNIRYLYSQSWPFPDSLMLGFVADYAGGEITVDGEEIAEADFYSIDDLPVLPGHGSIARRIIEEYIKDNVKNN